MKVVQAVDLFSGKAHAGERVLVIGGRERGMEAAAVLAMAGKDTWLSSRRELGREVDSSIAVTLLERLRDLGVVFLPFTTVQEIVDNRVQILDSARGERMTILIDTIVLAVGAVSQDKLAEEIRDLVPEIHLVGDCANPSNAKDTINSAAEVARVI